MSAEHSPIYQRGHNEASTVATLVEKVGQLPDKKLTVEDPTQLPLRANQWRIVLQTLQQTRPELFKDNGVIKNLSEEGKKIITTPLEDPDLQLQSTACLLMEYTTACLAREKGLWEVEAKKHEWIGFAIPGAGTELALISLERHAKPWDVVSYYYRQEAGDLYRGGTVDALLAQTVGSASDTHADGRQLAGHTSSRWRNQYPVISMVGAHVLTGVGAGQALGSREKLGLQGYLVKKEEAEDPDSRPVSFVYIGDAGMAEGVVKEAVDEMLIRGGSRVVLVVIDNEGGISTSRFDGSVGEDPIAFCRGLQEYGLKVVDADGANLQELFDKSGEVVDAARKGQPVVYRIYNVPKITYHSTSDDMSRYKQPAYLARMRKLDPLPRFREYLIKHGVATEEELDLIEELAEKKVYSTGDKILKEAQTDQLPPERLYTHVYAPQFQYGPQPIGEEIWKPGYPGEPERLQSTREPGVYYLDDEYRDDTFKLSMRQAINVTIAQEMKKDPRIIVCGQDDADFSRDDFEALGDHFEQKIELLRSEKGDVFSEEELERMSKALALIKEGRGYEVAPEDFAAVAAVVGGKGGVFKTTQFLQLLFGKERIWNSRLAEASIAETAIGYALEGFVPIVGIQFLAYAGPARVGLKDQLATLRWRSGGQFGAGVVIRIQGMSRLGGVGGIGHGEAAVSEFINIPGIRTVMPAHANEAGPLLREAIRIAREHGEPTVYIEPISLYNKSRGFYQGSEAHIPIGEAEIRQDGGEETSFVVLTWSNNLEIVEEAAEQWRGMGINPVIVNMRTLGPQTDWDTISPLIERHSKVMIVEAERGFGSAGTDLAARIAEFHWIDLDASIVRLSGRHMRTSAGKSDEVYQLPQVEHVVQKGKELYDY